MLILIYSQLDIFAVFWHKDTHREDKDTSSGCLILLCYFDCASDSNFAYLGFNFELLILCTDFILIICADCRYLSCVNGAIMNSSYR